MYIYNLLKFSGKQLCENLHPEVLPRFPKQAKDSVMMLAGTQEVYIVANWKVNSILIQAVTSLCWFKVHFPLAYACPSRGLHFKTEAKRTLISAIVNSYNITYLCAHEELQ